MQVSPSVLCQNGHSCLLGSQPSLSNHREHVREGKLQAAIMRGVFSEMLMVLSFDIFSLLMVLAGQHRTLDSYCYFYMYKMSIIPPVQLTIWIFFPPLRDWKLATHFCNFHWIVYALKLNNHNLRNGERSEEKSFQL